MSKRKDNKAKARRAAKARAAQVARHNAIEAKTLLTAEKPKSRIRRLFSLKALREGLLTFGAVAGVLCMLIAVAAFAFDVRPVIFRSGSMSPAIDTGALALSHTVQAKDLRVGDIVTVKTSAGIRVTHRIQNVTLANNHASLILKGDANSVVDDKAYRVASADREFLAVPKLGYVVSWLSGPIGIFAGGLLAGLLVLTAFGPGTRNQRKPGTRKLFGISVATLTLGLISTGVGGTTNTQAFYTDTANVQSGTFTSGNYPGAVGPTLSCTKGNSIVTMNWTAYAGATGYILHFGAGGGSSATVSAATLSRVFNVVGTSGTFTVEATTATVNSPLSNAKNYVIGNGVGNTDCTNAP